MFTLEDIHQDIKSVREESAEAKKQEGYSATAPGVVALNNSLAALTALIAESPNFRSSLSAAPAVLNSFDHIYVLGDDSEGGRSVAHSTAIAVGRKTILACAHSLKLVDNPSKRAPGNKVSLKYEENYWIQPYVTVTDGSIRNNGRIPIQLYKFYPYNDWALFQRTDGLEFTIFAEIDNEPADLPPRTMLNVRRPIVLLHCPVSLLRKFEGRRGEHTVNCNINEDVIVQAQSSHHLYYNRSNLVEGSLGGAIHWLENNKLVAMHCELVNEALFDEDDKLPKEIAATPKQVNREDVTYPATTILLRDRH